MQSTQICVNIPKISSFFGHYILFCVFRGNEQLLKLVETVNEKTVASDIVIQMVKMFHRAHFFRAIAVFIIFVRLEYHVLIHGFVTLTVQ